jgi:hypothetical protein
MLILLGFDELVSGVIKKFGFGFLATKLTILITNILTVDSEK